MGGDTKKKEVVSLDELEKSWDDSRTNLLELLGEDVQKSTSDKKDAQTDLFKSEEEDDDDIDREEEDDEEAEDDDEAEGVKKSIEDNLGDDPDAALAMDVEPFLRELVKSIDGRFDLVEKQVVSIASSVKTGNTMQKAMAQLFTAYGDLQKGMADAIEVIGNAPVKSTSVLRKSGDKFDAANAPKELDMSRDAILAKATHLREEGKLTVRDITKLESRLNKGMEIPDNIQSLLKEEK